MRKPALSLFLLPALLLGACAQAPAPGAPTAPPSTAATVAVRASAQTTPMPAVEPEFFRTQIDAMSQPRVLVHKAAHVLEVYDGDRLMARIRVALGSAPVGQKQQEGDGRTPEGTYYACMRNPKSKYYLSIGLSYPNTEDAQRGLDAGSISREQYERIADTIRRGARPPWDTPLGGEIMLPAGGTDGDWTAGCIAMAPEDMDYLWQHVALGTAVEIAP